MISQQEDLLEISDSIEESEDEKWKRIEKILNTGFIAIDLAEEYGGASSYVGEKAYAIATNLSEKELLATFSDELNPYKPYLLITGEMYKAIKELEYNDERERKREAMYHDSFSIVPEIYLLDELANPVIICESIQNLNYIYKRMMKLPDHQGSRVYKNCILGFTPKELSQLEGVSVQAICKSIALGKYALHKVFVKCGVVDKKKPSFNAYCYLLKEVAA